MSRAADNPFAGLSEYELRNVVPHLDDGSDHAALHRVFELATATGRNGWYEAQLALGDSAGYVADLGRAWNAAEAREDAGLQVRYALITATLNSLATNLPPEFIAVALERRVWTARRALSFVRQRQDPAARAEALAAIAPHVDAATREEVAKELAAALSAAPAGTLGRDAFEALPREIADRLPAAVRPEPTPEPDDPAAGARRRPAPALPAALERARAVKSRPKRVQALTELAPNGPGATGDAIRAEALDVARSIRPDQGKARALAAIALVSPEPAREAVVDECLAALPGDADSRSLLVELAPLLTPRQHEEALAAARALDEPSLRLEALGALYVHAPSHLRTSILRSRLAAARAEDWPPFKVEALMEILPDASRATRRRLAREALDVARARGPGWSQMEGLAALAPDLPDDFVPQAIDDSQAIGDGEQRSLLLVSLASLAGPPPVQAVMEEAIAVARSRPNYDDRTPILVALAPYLTASLHAEALAAVTPESGADFGEDSAAVQVLAALAPHLPDDQLSSALELAKGLGYLEARAQALGALGPYLPADLRAQALAAARAIPAGGHADGKHGGGRHHKADALAALAAALPEPERSEVLREAVETARATPWPRDRAATLADLVGRVPAADRSGIARDALAALAQAAISDHEAARILSLLVADAPHARLREAVSSLGDDAQRAGALLTCAEHATGARRSRAIRDALATARAIAVRGLDGDVDKVVLLARAATLEPDAGRRKAVLREALDVALGMEYPTLRMEAVAGALAPHLPPEDRERLLDRMLAGTRAYPYGEARLDGLLALAPFLAPAAKAEALREAVLLAGDEARTGSSESSVRLALPPLSGLSREALQALAATALHDLAVDSRALFLDRFRDVTPLIAALDPERGAAGARAAVLEVTGWWP
jgi:hypothetical protein